MKKIVVTSIGKGVAIAGIWLGVGIVSFSGTNYLGLIALYATISTIVGLIVWD